MTDPSPTNAVPTNVKSMFQAMGGATSRAAPVATGGFGDLWPKKGVYQAIPTEVSPEASVFKIGKESTGIPMVRLTFRFETLNQQDPATGETPKGISFRGRHFELFTDSDLARVKALPNLNPNVYDMIEKGYGRCRQHLGTILGRDPETVVDIGQAVEEVMTMIANNQTHAVELEVDEYTTPAHKVKPGQTAITYRTEYIRPLT